MKVYQLFEFHQWSVTCEPTVPGSANIIVNFPNRRLTYVIPYGISLFSQNLNVRLATTKPARERPDEKNVVVTAFNDGQREIVSFQIENDPTIYVYKDQFEEQARTALRIEELGEVNIGAFYD